MIAFADDYHIKRFCRSRTARVARASVADRGQGAFSNPAALAVLLVAATARKRRRLGDPAARPGATFRPDPPDLMTLREAGSCLPPELRETLPADLHQRLKFRLAEMFQMIDGLDFVDSSASEPGAGCAW